MSGDEQSPGRGKEELPTVYTAATHAVLAVFRCLSYMISFHLGLRARG